MTEPLVVTSLPLLFTLVLSVASLRFRRRNVDMGGSPPIDRRLFHTAKYAILVQWLGMIAHSWGFDLSFPGIPAVSKWLSLFLWTGGFVLLLIGRLGLADSFRIGSPGESTSLQVGGLFRLSRNPMYVGLYATLIASVMYTANPLLLLAALYTIVVHHRIVLAEEQFLRKRFGQDYIDYCGRVRRYL